MIFFVCALFLFHPGLQQEVMYRSAVLVLWSAEVIMYVFVFFFVIYSVGSFLRSRKRELGILLLHGMTEKQLRNLVFLEHHLCIYSPSDKHYRSFRHASIPPDS